MRDENEIFFRYQLDIEGLARFLYEHIISYDGDFASFYESVLSFWYLLSIISFMLSALFLIGIVYAIIRYGQLSEIEQEALREAERAFRHANAPRDEHSKWGKVTTHVTSTNPSDWRLAIIEADIMLDEMLDSLGYQGSSIGEKLKGASADVFRSVQDAWDAHKIRNEIAHRGSDFVLTKRTAQEAVEKYRRVFEEFKVI